MDFEGSNTPMGPNDPYSELIYHNDMIYEDWIGSKFIFVYKGVLAIKTTQGIVNKVFGLS